MNNNEKTLPQIFEEADKRRENGAWYPACGGTEKPFTCKGYRLLYLWQPSTGRHAYINLDTDIILSDDEAFTILNGSYK